jgi:hypothetical protein
LVASRVLWAEAPADRRTPPAAALNVQMRRARRNGIREKVVFKAASG